MTMDQITKTIAEMAYIIYTSGNTLLWHECVIAATNLYNAGIRQESEVEELQKKLNAYERVCGKLTVDGNHALIILSETTEYIPKNIADKFKHIAVHKAKQEVASKIIREIRNAIFAHGTKYAMKELEKIEKEYSAKDTNVLTSTNEVNKNE